MGNSLLLVLILVLVTVSLITNNKSKIDPFTEDSFEYIVSKCKSPGANIFYHIIRNEYKKIMDTVCRFNEIEIPYPSNNQINSYIYYECKTLKKRTGLFHSLLSEQYQYRLEQICK
jgi:predicted membrane-bound dolichyl-phosphate-mannose-protein mannosyltransferase